MLKAEFIPTIVLSKSSEAVMLGRDFVIIARVVLLFSPAVVRCGRKEPTELEGGWFFTY